MLFRILIAAAVASVCFVAVGLLQAAGFRITWRAYHHLLEAVYRIRPRPGERLPSAAILPIAADKLGRLETAVETSQQIFDERG